MFKRFKPLAHSVIGIDINPLSIHVVQLSKSSTQVIVEKAASEPLPPDAFIDHQIKNTHAVASCIKKVLGNTSLKGKVAVMAIPNAVTVTKMIQVSRAIHEKDMEEFVFLEASKYFSCPVSRINLDFIIQGPSATHPHQSDVLIMACRSENIHSRIQTLLETGLELKVIEIESNALERIMPWLTPPEGFPVTKPEQAKTLGMIRIRKHSASFHVIDSGKTTFSHEEVFTHEPYETTKQASYHPLDRILRHLKRMLQFFSSATSQCIACIFLAGDRLDLDDLARRLQEATQIPTTIANPFEHMNASLLVPPNQASSYLVACGLALRGVN